MATPHRCPVCCGTGQVPLGFYMRDGGSGWSATGTPTETCRSCWGGGIVWEYTFELPNLFGPIPTEKEPSNA